MYRLELLKASSTSRQAVQRGRVPLGSAWTRGRLCERVEEGVKESGSHDDLGALNDVSGLAEDLLLA